ncbi:MAG: hypothetical protein R3F59_12910 [Myxococcota bacterium]
MSVDPSSVGRLEPGRQTITLSDRLLRPLDAAAVMVLPMTAYGAMAAIGIALKSDPSASLCAVPLLAVAVAALAIVLRAMRRPPTTLVLRDAGLSVSADGVTRTVAYADLADASARRLAVHSLLVLTLERGETVEVPVGGIHRAQTMADAVLAAKGRASHQAEDPEVRRALDRLRGADTA